MVHLLKHLLFISHTTGIKMTINLNGALDVVVQITVILAALVGGFRWFKKWIHNQVVIPMKEAKRQLEPNGGVQDTTRHLIEQTSEQVKGIENSINDMGQVDKENRALIQNLTERFDKHLVEDHNK